MENIGVSSIGSVEKVLDIEHHPTIGYMVYNGYYKVMSNIPIMGQLPTPV
jgi:hypothetical protein